MADHGSDKYERMTGPKGEEIGVHGPECGHHCGTITVGNASQMTRHCSCGECHGPSGPEALYGSEIDAHFLSAPREVDPRGIR